MPLKAWFAFVSVRLPAFGDRVCRNLPVSAMIPTVGGLVPNRGLVRTAKYLCIESIREWLIKNVSILVVVGDVVSQSCNNCFIASFFFQLV